MIRPVAVVINACESDGVGDPVVVPHSTYRALAEGEHARRARYLNLFADEMAVHDAGINEIDRSLLDKYFLKVFETTKDPSLQGPWNGYPQGIKREAGYTILQ